MLQVANGQKYVVLNDEEYSDIENFSDTIEIDKKFQELLFLIATTSQDKTSISIPEMYEFVFSMKKHFEAINRDDIAKHTHFSNDYEEKIKHKNEVISLLKDNVSLLKERVKKYEGRMELLLKKVQQIEAEIRGGKN
ncbi:MAG: hypothetical protein JJT94_05705 [Bernardetiaceae bacterium]|nr:hypothetical protein [Bernardetiaceae bacterium]